MSYDLFADFDATTHEGFSRVLNKPGLDVMTRIRLLAATHVASESETHHQKKGIKELGRENYQEMVHNEYGDVTNYESFCTKQLKLMKKIGLGSENEISLEKLPSYSACIQFSFVLEKPYISKDDANFYIIDNPLKKEKVFKVPMIPGTTWKGNLRNAAIQNFMNNDSLASDKLADQRFRITLLFGDEGRDDDSDKSAAIAKYLNKKNSENYRRKIRNYYKLTANDPMPNHSGRLLFFPTYFDRLDLEVINPHCRETKVGTNPIVIECVPKGCIGFFKVLYLPSEFYFLAVEQSEESKKREMIEDIKLVSKAVKTMFIELGFGAKSNAGYGITQQSFPKTSNEKLGGVIRVKNADGKIIGYRMGGFSVMETALQKIAKKLEVGDE